MNVVCTIVAKNYFASAITLGNSLKKSNPEIDFVILLSDENENNIDLNSIEFKVFEAKNLMISKFMDMSFKYDVVEFCTSVKPFFIEYLMENFNYEKVIYLDPDIYVYDSLDNIFNKLEEVDLLLTPHIVTDSQTNEEVEREFLGNGIYNLGFAAFKNNINAKNILKWWKNCLEKYCFIDKNYNLYTDQKWMDLVPVKFSNVMILREKKYNIAWWNLSEREIIFRNNEFLVNEENGYEKISFFHYSGYSPLKENSFGRATTIVENKAILENFNFYKEELYKNGFSKYHNLPYKYSKFSSGEIILPIHRRVYKKIVSDNKSSYENPFIIGDGTFYELLKNRKLLIPKDVKTNIDSIKDDKIKNYYTVLNYIMKMTKNIIGIERYTKLLKYFGKISKLENQDFLIK